MKKNFESTLLKTIKQARSDFDIKDVIKGLEISYENT